MLLEKIHFEDSEAVSADERGSVGGWRPLEDPFCPGRHLQPEAK
jgi:hypothetical protein